MTMPKLSEQQLVEMGERGRQLLADGAFSRAVNMVNEMYWEEWRKTAPGDPEARELLYQKALVLDDVVTALAKVIGDGKIAADIRSRAKVQPIR